MTFLFSSKSEYYKKDKKEELKFMGFWCTSLSVDGHTGYLCWGALNAIG